MTQTVGRVRRRARRCRRWRRRGMTCGACRQASSSLVRLSACPGVPVAGTRSHAGRLRDRQAAGRHPRRAPFARCVDGAARCRGEGEDGGTAPPEARLRGGSRAVSRRCRAAVSAMAQRRQNDSPLSRRMCSERLAAVAAGRGRRRQAPEAGRSRRAARAGFCGRLRCPQGRRRRARCRGDPLRSLSRSNRNAGVLGTAAGA
jgi:hypothetical protein